MTSHNQAYLHALQKQGFENGETIFEAVQGLIQALGIEGSPGELFKQLKQFPEGSAPNLLDARGQMVSQFLRGTFALAGNATYKVGMNGFGQHGGGLLIVCPAMNYQHMLILRGTLYDKGTAGVVGGQGSDEDRGDDLAALLREQGEEVGKYPFDPARFFLFCTTQAWRTTDSRIEGYWVKAGFYIYLAEPDEMDAMHLAFGEVIAKKMKNPELDGLKLLTHREMLEWVKNGNVVYDEQAKAYLLLAMAIEHLKVAREAVKTVYPRTRNVRRRLQWEIARDVAMEDFELLIAHDDWRSWIDVDSLATFAE